MSESETAAAETAEQNQAAATSGAGLAGGQTTDHDAQQNSGAAMYVNPEVRAALDAEQAALRSAQATDGADDVAGAQSPEALIEMMEASVHQQVLEAPLDDPSAEQHLAAAIRGFRRAGLARYQDSLTGHATTQAEILRTLGEAEEHLRGHIALIQTTKEAANG